MNKNNIIKKRSEKNVTITVAFFIQGLQIIQKDVLASALSVFRNEPFHHFRFDISKILQECTFTYLESENIRGLVGQPIQKRTPLSRMRKSVLQTVNLILVPMERESSLPGLRIEVSHSDSASLLNVFLDYWGLKDAERTEISCC